LVYLGTYKSDFLFLVPAASCTRLARAPRLNAAQLLPGSTLHARSSNKAHQVKRKQLYSTRPPGPSHYDERTFATITMRDGKPHLDCAPLRLAPSHAGAHHAVYSIGKIVCRVSKPCFYNSANLASLI
jgi:hypothetical protein